MMIDSGLLFPGGPPLQVTPPASGTPGPVTSSSFGYDLNPDFGTGPGNPVGFVDGTKPTGQIGKRRSPLPGMGDDIVLLLEVTTAFVAGAGAPLAQFHVALSDVGGSSFITSGTNNYCVIGSTNAPFVTAGGITYLGYTAAQLTLGAKLQIRINPWDAIMGRSILGATISGRDLRYIGLVMMVPNFAVAGFPFFSAGTVRGHFAKMGENIGNPQDTLFPAGTVNVG